MPNLTACRIRHAWAFVASALALAGTLAPTKASAQYQPGDPGGRPEAVYSPLEPAAAPPRTGDKVDVKGETAAHGREATVELAKCILKRHRSAAKNLIELSADSSVVVPELTRLARECLASGELRIPPLLLRGALFEELYKQEFEEAGSQDLSKAPPIDYLQGYQQPLSEASKQALAMSFVGDCLVRADTSSARLMVASIPGTAKEHRATGAIAARLPQCIPQGQTIRFSRSFIRAAVSEALYRLSREQMKTATNLRGRH